MSKRVSIMCKRTYEFEGKTQLVKGNIYTIGEGDFYTLIKNPTGPFYDYFYTQEEMRTIRLQEMGI
jgi:hypothetical protein